MEKDGANGNCDKGVMVKDDLKIDFAPSKNRIKVDMRNRDYSSFCPDKRECSVINHKVGQ